MADSMTPGNRLYIYRLLSEKLGYGKQVTIERAEEVLTADDVQAADVGFDSARTMLESKHFQGSARVEVFKKGRILVTMLRNAELDAQLLEAQKAEEEKAAAKAAQAAKPAGKQAKGAGKGAKGGKNQWAGVKATVKPSKPGEQRRKLEAKAAKAAAEAQAKLEAEQRAEREAREAAERAEAERIAREEAERIARETAEREAREAEERARQEAEAREAAQRAREEARQRALDEQRARVTTPIAELKTGLRVTYDPIGELPFAAASKTAATKPGSHKKTEADKKGAGKKGKVAAAKTQKPAEMPSSPSSHTQRMCEDVLASGAKRGVTRRRTHAAAVEAAPAPAIPTMPADDDWLMPTYEEAASYVPAEALAAQASAIQETVANPDVFSIEDAPSNGVAAVAGTEAPRADITPAQTSSLQAASFDSASNQVAPVQAAPYDSATGQLVAAQAALSASASNQAVAAHATLSNPVVNQAPVQVASPHSTATQVALAQATLSASATNQTAPAQMTQQPAPISTPVAQPCTPQQPPAASVSASQASRQPAFAGHTPAAHAAMAFSPNPDRQVPTPEVLADYPQSISRDVFCPTAILSTLSRILPVQVDLMAVLDEDWSAARAMGTVCGSRSRAVFPLRYLREDGSQPVELTLKRTGKPGLNMRWAVALVDGDDGTGDMHETASLEGLPVADQGAWSDLGTPSPRGSQAADPIREFATFASISTWDAMLGDLARMVAPERWSYPGTEVAPSAAGATRYGILREYLVVTFHRVRAQGKLETSSAGDFAAFNTGLATPSGDDVFACFEPCRVNTPWRFAGFALAGSGDLGRRITSELGCIPQAATYLTSLDDVVPQPDARVALDFHTLLDDCLGRLPRGFLRDALADMEGPCGMLDRMGDTSLPVAQRTEAQVRLARFITGTPAVYRRLTRALDDAVDAAIAACRRNYRLAVPVFDPAADAMKLLLPLCLVNDRQADVALVVQRQPSGIWQGTRFVSLPRAYVSARVVSAEQPQWLTFENVLG